MFVGINQEDITEWKTFMILRAPISSISELTCASLRALNPTVVNVSVASTSTVTKPSTARSAATDSAGFPELAALWARHGISNGCDA